MKRKKYQFQLFGGLLLTVEGKTLDLGNQLEKQLYALLAYMLCNHNQSVSKERIISAFWENSDNPVNALKYAIHRLRNSLKKIPGLPDKELIVTVPTGYQFNPEIYVEIDTERFEGLVQRAKAEQDIELYKQALELYKGDFVEGANEEWAINDRGYYCSIFTQLCHALATHYIKERNGKEAVIVCEKGLGADEYDETLIHSYLQALMLEKRFNYAQDYYNTINKKYKKKLGFTLDYLDKENSFNYMLSEQILQEEKEKKAEAISVALGDSQTDIGPMKVSTQEFNLLCAYELRNIGRYLSNEYIICATLDAKNGQQNEMMKIMMNILELSLRKSDVIAKLDNKKVALLVKLAQESDVELLYNRINTRLSERVEEYSYSLTYIIKLIG